MPGVVESMVVNSILSGGVLGSIAGVIGVQATVAGLTYFGAQLVLGPVSSALGLTPKPSSIRSASITQQGQTVTTRQPTANHVMVYGRTRVGGSMLYLGTTDGNKYLHMVVALTGHEIDAVETIYANDEEVAIDGSGVATSSNYRGKLRFQFKTGADDQAAFSDLVSATSSLGGAAWTSAHRVRGSALVYVRLEYDADKFPNGVPNFSFVIRGKKVYDPRSGATAWSANPALCLADYLCDTRHGLGSDYATEVDETALIAAANVCDEDISLTAGGTENRYETHGIIDSGNTPQDIIPKLLSSMAGKCVRSGGRWRIVPGVYYTPALTLDENDLRGGLRVQTLVSRRENFNAVKGVFLSKQDNYIATDFPQVSSATFKAQDGGQSVYRSVELPFTTSASMAQRLAKIELLKARQQITVAATCGLRAIQVRVGDVVQISNTRMGWVSKKFEVVDMTMGLGVDMTVSLDLREISTDVFDWSTSEEQTYDPAPNSALPNAFNITPPGIWTTDVLEISAETIITKLVVTVSGETTFQDRYEVQAKLQADAEWINLGQSAGNVFQLPNVVDGAVYDVRARSINVLGVRSAWAQVAHEVVGKTAPPANVEGFTINVVGTQAYLTWRAVADLDLSHYRIRHSRSTSGATYANAVDLVPKVSRPATFAITPAMTGTYFIKAIDKLGNESPQAASTVAIIEDIKDLNVISTITESPSFSGVKTDCVATSDGYLVLDTSVDFDDLVGDFDAALGLFDSGSVNVSSIGSYEFASHFDLSQVYTSRLTALLDVTRLDYVNLFDDVVGDFDDRVGLFDGDPNTYGNTNVELYVATTDDDPSGSPTWSTWRPFFVGDYKARAFKFKAVLTSNSSDSSPQLETLTVNVDMPDRVVSGDNITSGSGVYAVAFAKAFKATPAVAISAENLAQGDYYEINSKSAAGFSITFKNSSGSAVSRTFDYVAKGYGELATA